MRGRFVRSGQRHLVKELRSTAIRLLAYFGVLAAVGYGAVALIGGEVVSVLGTADQKLQATKSKATTTSRGMFHASLPPKLRGMIEE